VKVPLRSVFLVTSVGYVTVPAGVTVVEVNVAGSVTIVLPSARDPAVIAQERLFAKRPFMITDVGGTAGTYPILIQPQVGETIMGLSAISIHTNYGGVTLTPSTTLQGWMMIKP
jgi:hypothetical protein